MGCLNIKDAITAV